MGLDLSHVFNRVWVIESLRPGDPHLAEDLYDNVLVPRRSPAMVPEYRRVGSKQDLLDLLSQLAADARREEWPMVHLETHGSQAGVELTSGELLPWRELLNAFRPINEATQFNLVVTMAACLGAHMHVGLHLEAPAPLLYLIGPRGKKSHEDLYWDFSNFYQHLLDSDGDMAGAFAALNGMREVGNGPYALCSAEYFFERIWEEYVKHETTPTALSERENLIVARRARRGNRDLLDAAWYRLWVRGQLANQENFFRLSRRAFFMLDRFPQNEVRVGVSWERVQDLAGELGPLGSQREGTFLRD